MNPSRVWLTTVEVADRLRTPVETVRYWRYVGKGPRWAKVGRRVLYDLADVEAFETQLLRGASA